MAILEGETRFNSNSEMFKRAQMAASEILGSNTDKVVKLIYNLNEKINEDYLKSIDLFGFLRKNNITDVQFSEKRLKDYFLYPLTTTKIIPRGWEGKYGHKKYNNTIYRIYLDTHCAIGLFYKGRPNALVGLLPTDADTLMIYQLQGVMGEIPDSRQKVSSRGLMPIDWQKLLVDIVENIGKDMNYSQIGIQSGYNNKWTKTYGNSGNVRLFIAEAVRKYDKVAERLNFKQADDYYRNWYRSIK